MSQFANLMALSATQTKQSQSAVEIALRERQRKEALRRKQQEEQEEKEREIEKKRRIKLFEDQKREQERLQRLEATRKAREVELQRREVEQRDALRYGPKKAAKMAHSSPASGSPAEPKWPTSSSSARDASRGRRRHSDVSDDDSPAMALTREELRMKKQQAEMKRLYNATKRTSSHSNGYHKAGRKLPGGAVDITSSQSPAAFLAGDSSSAHKSVKDRLAAMPNTLTKLNQVKRDTRTIDEILQDRAKAKEGKVLQGEEALDFDDWFGTKKKEKKNIPSPPVRPASAATSSGSGANTPSYASAASAHKKPAISSKPIPVTAKPSTSIVKATSSSSSAPPRTSNMFRNPVPEKHKSALPKINKSIEYPSSKSTSVHAAPAKKRPRSDSRSESPPPQRKRRRSVEPADKLDEDYSATIWKLFGRDRKQYVSKDVYSDDEDMEADANVLEREELLSSRIAKREEQLALASERKHEEEKRRRKKERERGLTAGRGGC